MGTDRGAYDYRWQIGYGKIIDCTAEEVACADAKFWRECGEGSNSQNPISFRKPSRWERIKAFFRV